jgi:hypothetical protein
MITLLKPTILDAAALAGAESAHHLATVLRTQWTAFWQRDPTTVVADMQEDLQQTLAIFALNNQAALAVNALLDAVNDPRFCNRAPTDLPANWSFDGQTFTYNEPISDIPDPDIEP